jgi:uncharacterized protein (DUF2141 family)
MELMMTSTLAALRRGLFPLLGGLAASAAAAQAPILGPDAAACRSGSNETALLVVIDGFKHRDGLVRAEVYPANDDDFLKLDHRLKAEGKFFRRIEVAPPRSGPAKICVRLPEPGDYAVVALHTTNVETHRRKFNFREDGVGFVNNPRLGLNQPKAERVSLTARRGVNEEVVILNYLRGLAMRPIPGAATRTAERR